MRLSLVNRGWGALQWDSGFVYYDYNVCNVLYQESHSVRKGGADYVPDFSLSDQ